MFLTTVVLAVAVAIGFFVVQSNRDVANTNQQIAVTNEQIARAGARQADAIRQQCIADYVQARGTVTGAAAFVVRDNAKKACS